MPRQGKLSLSNTTGRRVDQKAQDKSNKKAAKAAGVKRSDRKAALDAVKKSGIRSAVTKKMDTAAYKERDAAKRDAAPGNWDMDGKNQAQNASGRRQSRSAEEFGKTTDAAKKTGVSQKKVYKTYRKAETKASGKLGMSTTTYKGPKGKPKVKAAPKKYR
jgi:hypothetical protein